MIKVDAMMLQVLLHGVANVSPHLCLIKFDADAMVPTVDVEGAVASVQVEQAANNVSGPAWRECRGRWEE